MISSHQPPAAPRRLSVSSSGNSGADVRGDATGEPRRQVVHRLDVRVRRRVDRGPLGLEPEPVRERVAAAAARRHAVSLEPELPELGTALRERHGSALRRACRGRARAGRAGDRRHRRERATSTGCRTGSPRRERPRRAPSRARSRSSGRARCQIASGSSSARRRRAHIGMDRWRSDGAARVVEQATRMPLLPRSTARTRGLTITGIRGSSGRRAQSSGSSSGGELVLELLHVEVVAPGRDPAVVHFEGAHHRQLDPPVAHQEAIDAPGDFERRASARSAALATSAPTSGSGTLRACPEADERPAPTRSRARDELDGEARHRRRGEAAELAIESVVGVPSRNRPGRADRRSGASRTGWWRSRSRAQSLRNGSIRRPRRATLATARRR